MLTGFLMSGLPPSAPISVNVVFIHHGDSVYLSKFPVSYECIYIVGLDLGATLTIRRESVNVDITSRKDYIHTPCHRYIKPRCIQLSGAINIYLT